MRIGTSLGRSRGPLAGVIVFAAFAVFLTALVAGTLSRGSLGSTHGYSAVFVDASGLHSGDDVRIAGVRVGKVTGIRLDGKNAKVSFDLQDGSTIYANTSAAIDYLNLMGQRYIALRLPGKPGAVLGHGSTIPLQRTSVGLDLTAMFNAFKPLFVLLKPADVNVLANDIVQVLQGEGSTVKDLVAQTATMTGTLAHRDQVIDAVITNVTAVMGTVSAQRSQIASIVTELDGLTATVAQHRNEIASTIDAAQTLVTSVAGLIGDLREPLNADVGSLAAWATSFGKQTPKLAAALSDTQLLLKTYIKTLGLGSYLNTYVCNSLIQMGNAPAQEFKVSNKHSQRCR